MVHSSTLPNDASLETVAQQVAALLDTEEEMAAEAQKIALPSIPVWVLHVGPETGNTGLDPDGALPLHQGQRHHQIYADGQQPGYIRVRSPQADDPVWRVTELATDQLAERLDNTAAWLEEHVDGDPFARLLVVPAFYLHSFWLVDDGGAEDRYVVADLRDGTVALERNVVYGEAEFFHALRRGTPIVGLTSAYR